MNIKAALRRLVNPLLCVVMIAYIAVAMCVVMAMASVERCRGVEFNIHNSAAARNFVTEKELNRDLGDLKATAPGRPLSKINTADIERRLAAIDKIEEAKVLLTTGGVIRIDVTPMQPVARVFDGSRSYYINKDGKRMVADARYHVDVPILEGHFDSMNLRPESFLSLVRRIDNDPTWGALVSVIKVQSPGDVMLIPVIRGHVINLGDTLAMDDKLSRLRTFYTEVLSHKGWSHYDTISVKWSGQIVATRAKKGLGELPSITEDIDDSDDATTMLPTDQSLPPEAISEKERIDAKQAAEANKPTATQPAN